jgi:hypothetical protein
MSGSWSWVEIADRGLRRKGGDEQQNQVVSTVEVGIGDPHGCRAAAELGERAADRSIVDVEPLRAGVLQPGKRHRLRRSAGAANQRQIGHAIAVEISRDGAGRDT